MKKTVLYCLLAVIAFSCASPSPTETAQQFIKALYASDITTATALSSSATKGVIAKSKTASVNTVSAEEAFQFGSLSEAVSDGKAEVKNNIIALPMVKEEGEWKVVMNETLLSDIQGRDELLSGVKTKWESLLKEYKARITIAKEYIGYKKNSGALSPQAKALSNMLDSFAPEQAWTGEALLAFVQKQQALTKAIDNALEPSSAANTDLTLNYFMQISSAGDRIKQAEEVYQSAAQKAGSPVYVPLPSAVNTTIKTAKN